LCRRKSERSQSPTGSSHTATFKKDRGDSGSGKNINKKLHVILYQRGNGGHPTAGGLRIKRFQKKNFGISRGGGVAGWVKGVQRKGFGKCLKRKKYQEKVKIIRKIRGSILNLEHSDGLGEKTRESAQKKKRGLCKMGRMHKKTSLRNFEGGGTIRGKEKLKSRRKEAGHDGIIKKKNS